MTAALLIARAWLKAAWEWANTPWGRRIVAALAVILALWAVHHHGYSAGYRAGESHQLAVQAAADEKARKEAKKVEAKAADLGETVGAKVEARQAANHAQTRIIIQKVTEYVPFDPGRGDLPVGLVRLHDAAVLGLPVTPDPAGRPNDAPSGYADPDLATAIAENAGICRDNAEALRGWQDYWRGLEAIWPKPPG